MVEFIEDLSHMLVGHCAFGRERFGVRVAIATIRIMRELYILDQWPDDIVQKMQVRHIFVFVLPGEHHGFEDIVRFGSGGRSDSGERDGVFHSAPHAAVHHDTVVDMVT